MKAVWMYSGMVFKRHASYGLLGMGTFNTNLMVSLDVQ